ncbi:EI24 domain-containing protein [Sphingomonas hylomeconis]|uniref:EI24 domain-containing protein n=1 Tax=Sphingomonas hylomeconis TaxID=1395958 RepID=A0ABV7STQ6_9SPHN|nr:EI24 domain-containing protein [Sphingomonas hylomeconis]
MIRAFFLSLAQLGDRRIIGVFLKSLALTLVLLAALGVGAWYALTWAVAYWGFGSGAQGIAGVAAVILALVTAGVLFRGVAVLVIGLFADEVVQAVEAKHYPQALTTARAVPLARSIGMGLGSVARFAGINLLLVPVYLLLLVTGIGPAILFFIVNGWLLGRDLGDMVAVRHMGMAELKGWRGATALSRFVLGLIGTGLFVVPFVNLAAPVIVAAMATHWFHQGRRK